MFVRRAAAVVVAVITAVIMCLPPSMGASFAETSEAGGSDASQYFHVEITSDSYDYVSRQAAIFKAAYTIDQNKIKEGDYIEVQVPEDLASKVKFSVSTQHFSRTENMGGGLYRLYFGKDAASAISGSFQMSFTAENSSTETKTGTVKVGSASKTFTVQGQTSGGGTGTFDYGIRKDANGNDVISWKGYDHSDPGSFHQIGVYDCSQDVEPIFRLLINEREADIHDVVVNDTLPDGMEFEEIVDAVTGSGTKLKEGTDYTFESSGQKLTFHINGRLTDKVTISYKVKIQKNSGFPIVNKSSVSYTREDGTKGYEVSDFTAQGSSYSAANGVKTVDKTEISSDPADQAVTYTFHFWNDQAFEPGTINFTDKLDSHVDFMSCDGVKNQDGSYTDGYFTLTPVKDADGTWSVSVTNSKKIAANISADVSFTVDFSRVPEGYTVVNAVNGSKVETKKKLSEKTSVSGTKTWKDNDDQDGKRPPSITVNLKKDGKVIDSKKVTAADDWKYSFTGLDKYENGKEINYTVEEEAVPGYTTEVQGYNLINTYKTENHNGHKKNKKDIDNHTKKKKEVVKTGDESSIYEYATLLVTAAAACILLLVIRRKRDK